MSSAVRSIAVLVFAQYCCADSLHLPKGSFGDDVSGSSALCMIDFSLGQADANLLNLQTTKIPKTLPLATSHADGNVFPTTTNYVAPPLDWNLLATHASFAAAPIVALSRMISVIIGGASPQLTIINQGEMVATTPSPTILMCSALKACSTSHVDAIGEEEEGALGREEAISRGLGGADANRMKSQTLEISKTHTLAETYAIRNNALGNEEECALALGLEETINGLKETAHEAVIELPANLGWAPMPWLYGNMHQIADQLEDVRQSLVLYQAILLVAIPVISVVICFIIGSIRLSKIIVSGRRMIIMIKPSAVLMCLTLVASFAGYADASFNYSGGLCLKRASGLDGCTAEDVHTNVTKYTGPPNCTEGESIRIGFTMAIEVKATKRYDLGVYVGINGSNALSDQGNTSCLVQTLGVADSMRNDGRVADIDGDDCWDFKDNNGTIVGFEINYFDYQCTAGKDGKAVVYACFAWDQNSKQDCPSTCAYSSSGQTQCLNPGTTSKCECDDISIPVVVRTESPSSSPSENPSGNPSSNPSENPSGNPSSNPSENPSGNPSSNPSENPSGNPSSNPSENPSGNPSSNPSENPSQNPSENPSSIPTSSPIKPPGPTPTCLCGNTSSIGVSSQSIPLVDGYIKQTGDGWGDDLDNWKGSEYSAFAQIINMTISGNRSGNKYDVVGEALAGYDRNTKKFCVAAYLLNIHANDGCGLEEKSDEAWVKFGPDSEECSFRAGTKTLNNNTLGAKFEYVKYPDASGRTIGYEACWDMTYEAGFTPGVLVKVHVNRVCDNVFSDEDTIATEARCLFWIASPTTARPTTASPTFTPTTGKPTTMKPTKKPALTNSPMTKKPNKRPNKSAQGKLS